MRILLYIFLLKLGEAIATKAEQLPPPNDSHFFDDHYDVQSSLPLEISEGLVINTDTIQMDTVPRGFASNGVLDTFVIGLPNSGEAKVYKLVDDNAETCQNDQFGCRRWVQLGNTLTGLRNKFGLHVTMNQTGDRIAIGSFKEDNAGAVRVYRMTNDNNNNDCGADIDECWEQIGEKITGGSKVAMDNTGLQLVIHSDNGITKAYGLSSNCANDQDFCWEQKGQNIPGFGTPFIVYGNPLAFANDGNMVAIGNPSREEVVVYVYKECSTDTFCWIQIGEKITSEQPYDRFGQSIAFNEASDRIIVGAPFHNVDGDVNKGVAKIYDLITSDCGTSNNSHCWKQIGQAITGDLEYDKLGGSVSLSRDGSIAAIGSPYADNAIRKNVGKIQLFELQNSGSDTKWKLKAERIFDAFDDDNENTRGATYLGMNHDGDTIISADSGYPGRLTRYRVYPCDDSPRKFLLNGKERPCSWVRQNPNKIAHRCSKEGISSHCPASCGTCNMYSCKDSDQRFTLWNTTKKKSCKWVGQKEETVSRRCGKSGGGIEKTCRETCGRCSDV
jgi:hypothetical protein